MWLSGITLFEWLGRLLLASRTIMRFMIQLEYQITPQRLAIIATINTIPLRTPTKAFRIGIGNLAIQLEAHGATLGVATSFDREKTAIHSACMNPTTPSVVRASQIAVFPKSVAVTFRQLSDARCEWEIRKIGNEAPLEGTVTVFANVETTVEGSTTLISRVHPTQQAIFDARGRRLGKLRSISLFVKLRRSNLVFRDATYCIVYPSKTESRESRIALAGLIEPREESLTISEPIVIGMRDVFNPFPAPVSDRAVGLPSTSWDRVEQAIRKAGGSKNG